MEIFLTILLSYSIYASLIQVANAVGSTSVEKGLSILINVVGVDPMKYTVTPKEYKQYNRPSYHGILPQEDVTYDLSSAQGKMKMLFTFANSTLQMLQVLENEGTQHVNKTAANAVESATNFLSNYQAYTSNSLYGALNSTLENVVAGRNVTKSSGNTLLEVTDVNGYATFKWTYTFNGVRAPSKFVAISFNNSFLACFVDNWQPYKIGNTDMTLSKEQAIAIALDTAKAHNWSLPLDKDTLETKNFNESSVRWAALLFDCSVNANKARSQDLLALYPVWRVGISLNKWCGQLYGIEVDIWADSKQVRYVQEAWSTLPPPQGISTANATAARASTNQAYVTGEANTSLIDCIMFPAIAGATFSTAIAVVGRKKIGHSLYLQRPRVFKIARIVVCSLLLSVILSVPVGDVSATYSGSAYVWGSESAQAKYENGTNWRKSSNELYLQDWIAPYISDYFADAGFDSADHQGTLSHKPQILTDLEYMNAYWTYGAVVDFDHGVGTTSYSQAPSGEFHYMFEDQNGTEWGPPPGEDHLDSAIYDMDIYSEVSSVNIIFAFINTCLSADINKTGKYPNGTQYDSWQGIVNPNDPPSQWRARGMPFAWTHRSVGDRNAQGFNAAYNISDDGYRKPDAGAQVYIGFPWGSASLEQRIPSNSGGGSYYHDWVLYFFHYALHIDMTVNVALDTASQLWYGSPFGTSYFQTPPGFEAYWWNFESDIWANSTMKVFGNGNIRLRSYSSTAAWNDNFDDNAINTDRWEKLENGATVNEANSRLEVTVPTGSGQVQAGYVTKNAYDVRVQSATVDVPEFNSVGEMILQIGTTKTNNSDPYSQDNWYRILKSKYTGDTNIYVQRRVNGTLTTMFNTPWSGATVNFTISVRNGYIAFFENGTVRHSEPFALSSYNCHIYMFTSTDKTRASGADAFDNFAYSPTTYCPNLENFTTYTELDPNGHINVASSQHVDFNDYANEDARLYKDKGAGYFGSNWEQTVDFRVNSASGTYAYNWFWGLTNDLDDYSDLWDAGKPYLALFSDYYSGAEHLYLAESYRGTNYYSFMTIYYNTWYYLTIQKTGNILICKVYSDSARTDLINTLSLTLHSDQSFRYILSGNTFNDGSSNYSDGDIENLALQSTPPPPPGTEDFTTYTELDPNGHINVASSQHVDFNDYANEDARLYKDKGAGYFGSNWEHKIDFKVNDATGTYAYNWFWGLTNDLDDYSDLWDAAKPYLALFTDYYGGAEYLYLAESHQGANYYSFTRINFNTWYYLTIQKAGTALTCKIYSDSARTNLVTTLSLTLHADQSFRYIMAGNTFNDGSSNHSDVDIENLYI